MRIVSLVPEGVPSSLYRSLAPLQALALLGHDVQVEERREVGDPAALLDADVVHIFRLWHPATVPFARRLIEQGVAVVWDNDFDLRVPPRGHPVEQGLRSTVGQQASAAVDALVRLATLVTAPTEELAERQRAAGAADVRVLENWLPPTFRRPDAVPESAVTIGWAGMTEHQWDFDQLKLRKVLTKVLDRHPDVRMLAIGADAGLSSPRYQHLPWQPYDSLPALMAHCDIAIAPLADHPYNETRSNVKLKEYAALGIPWLASPVGDYAWMGEDEGGRLVADGDWLDALEALLGDAAARAELGRNGRDWAAEEYAVDHADEVEQLLLEAVELAAA